MHAADMFDVMQVIDRIDRNLTPESKEGALFVCPFSIIDTKKQRLTVCLITCNHVLHILPRSKLW